MNSSTLSSAGNAESGATAVSSCSGEEATAEAAEPPLDGGKLTNAAVALGPTTNTCTRVPLNQTAPNDPFQSLGVLDIPGQEMLKHALSQWRNAMGAGWEKALTSKEIFWTNIWQPNPVKGEISFPPGLVTAMHLWCQSLLPEHYPDELVEVDGIGFIVNPMGSRTQPWHLDYTRDYATVFIPLTPINSDNATQYVTLSPDTPLEAYARATANLDVVDLEPLINGSSGITICQKVARPFSILKMDFETIHRGISNAGTFHRINFFYSMRRSSSAASPQEGLVQDFSQ